VKDVCYAPYDTLVIPKGSKHKQEAFEFIAYVNRQDVMEKLCNAHSKNSPLQKVSQEFLEHHKNPYIKVFEDLANSPNAQTIPKLPIMPEVGDELTNVAQSVALLEAEPEDALRVAQDRLQASYDDFMAKQRARQH
jgi:maltose-binding protein MalE